MEKSPKNFTKYSKYFALNIPRQSVVFLLTIFLGLATGVVSGFIIYGLRALSTIDFASLGAYAGFIAVSLPTLITAAIYKIIIPRLKLKHLLFSSFIIEVPYSFFIFLSSFLFILTKNVAIAYIPIILGNAGVYAYWLFISFFILQKRMKMITAMWHPVLNVLFSTFLSVYLFNSVLPVRLIFLKLTIGMATFALVIYFIIFFINRPSKKILGVGSLEVFVPMVTQWLFNVAIEPKKMYENGHTKEVTLQTLVARKNGTLSCVFLNPSIHFGPYAGVGGSIATKYFGEKIKLMGADPVIIHTSVNLDYNPSSSEEIYKIWKSAEKSIKSSTGAQSRGRIGFGKFNNSRAIGIELEKCILLFLSRAPFVTEDIEKGVGDRLSRRLSELMGKEVILVDAHNSRYESASQYDKKGVFEGCKYEKEYERAIEEMARDLQKKSMEPLLFGSYSEKLALALGKPKDLGSGYASLLLFHTKNEKLCIVYIDSNNMLPSMRRKIVDFFSKKGYWCETATTDTHEVNALSLNESNVFGRHTSANDCIKELYKMFEKAKSNLSQCSFSFSSSKLKVKVWGEDMEKKIYEVSRQVIFLAKKVIPFVIVAGFIFAAIAIYLI
ncbi:MAG: DUF2070 family protein [Candidatus Micrarchaeaceae archaeon]